MTWTTVYHGCNRWTTGSESSALPQGYARFGRLFIHHSGLAAESRTMVFTAAWTIECMATILFQFSFFLCECLRRSFISKVDKKLCIIGSFFCWSIIITGIYPSPCSSKDSSRFNACVGTAHSTILFWLHSAWRDLF